VTVHGKGAARQQNDGLAVVLWWWRTGATGGKAGRSYSGGRRCGDDARRERAVAGALLREQQGNGETCRGAAPGGLATGQVGCTGEGGSWWRPRAGDAEAGW
jgi:hypothetical protein